MYHCTCAKGCYDNSWHEVFECRYTFSFECQDSTPDGPANDAESQDLVLISVRSADSMKLEYQCKET